MIAEPNVETIQKELESEALQYKDMIQFRFKDYYYNFTLKLISILRSAQYKCLDMKYIMKTDDDIIINVKQLVKKFKNFKSGITGILKPQENPIRDNKFKNCMPQNIYPDEYYPDLIFGPRMSSSH